MDLPQPNSPTIASVRARGMANDTLSTRAAMRDGVSMATPRFCTRSTASGATVAGRSGNGAVRNSRMTRRSFWNVPMGMLADPATAGKASRGPGAGVIRPGPLTGSGVQAGRWASAQRLDFDLSMNAHDRRW